MNHHLRIFTLCLALVTSRARIALPPSANNRHGVLGLEVAGRIKCLVLGNDRSSRSAIFPQNKKLLPGQPDALLATFDYRFSKARWYGLQQIGSILQWQPQFTQSKSISPKTLAVSIESKTDTSSPVDAVAVKLDWENDYSTDAWQERPSIEFRADQSLEKTLVGFFLPIARRVHLHWTSHLPWKDSAATGLFAKSFPSDPSPSSKPTTQPIINEDWWLPELRLDPSVGRISSKNQIQSRWRDRYDVQVHLKLSRSVRFMSFNDGDDGETHVRLECNVADERSRSTSTARLEAIVDPTLWRQSLASSRLVLIHEQMHSKNVQRICNNF